MDEILNLIESVSEGFPSYFSKSCSKYHLGPEMLCKNIQLVIIKLYKKINYTERSIEIKLYKYSKIPILRPPFGLLISGLIREVVLMSNIKS